MRKLILNLSFVAYLLAVTTGCETLYGWKIHASGLLSEEFSRDIPTSPHRIALYIPEGMSAYISKDKGTRLSDPQTYFIGEAFVPMLIESFQQGFQEFVLMEALPTFDIMQRYGIEYLAVVEIKEFKNRKKYKEQGLDVYTETTLFKPDLKLLARFETRGASDAPRVFAKKGGPEMNLNHAIESNLRSVVTYIQDYIQTQAAV